MSDALERVRALRRDGYRCQYRDALGVPCGQRTGFVRDLDGAPVTTCRDHLETPYVPERR